MNYLKKIFSSDFLWCIYFFLIQYENILDGFFGIKTQLKPYRLVSILIFCLVIYKALKNNNFKLRLKSSDMVLYAMLIVGLIVTFINYYFDPLNFDDSIFFITIFQILLGFIVYNLLRTKDINEKLFHQIFTYYTFGLALNCIFLIVQSYFFVETLDYKRPSGFISNPNSAGLQMSLAIFYLVYKIKQNPHRKFFQYFNILLIVLFVTGVFQTQSRTSLLLVIIICLVSYFNLSAVRKIQVAAISIIAILGLGGIILNSEMISRIQRKSKSNRQDERIEIWNKSIELGIDTKFLGIGIGQFQRRSYARAYFSSTNFPSVRSELRKGEIGLGLHNTFLHILINYGIVSFILFIVYLLSVNRKLFLEVKKRNFKSNTIPYFNWGAFLLILFFSFSGEILLSPFFWALFALFNSTIHNNENDLNISHFE